MIDALIDSNDMLKDWECMTDLLLEEPGNDEEGMLIFIMALIFNIHKIFIFIIFSIGRSSRICFNRIDGLRR